MATSAPPSYASPQTGSAVRRSQLLSDAIRQMQDGRTTDSYRTNTATIANTLADAVLGYARNNADARADKAIAADKVRVSDLIRDQFPGQANPSRQRELETQQLGANAAFDLTPQANETRAQQTATPSLASLLFETTGDPTAAINAGLGQRRQAIEDARYKDERDYSRGRDVRADFVADRAYDTSVDQFDRRLGQDSDQFGKTFGLQRDQFGETVRHNKATEGLSAAEIAAKAAGAKAPKPEDIGALRKEWNSQASDFRGVRDAYSRVVASGDGSTPAQQMSMIFAYMKMLDPTSAVRETEYANAENARGVPTAVQNVWNKLIDGQFLAPSQIEDFKAQAASLYGQAEGDYGRSYDFYRQQAQDADMSPDIIQDFRIPMQAPTSTVVSETVTRPDGVQMSREKAIQQRNIFASMKDMGVDLPDDFISKIDAMLSAGPSDEDLVKKWSK